MQCDKLFFWFTFIIISSDGQIIESEQIREKYRQSTPKNPYTILSDTISQVSHESNLENCNDDIGCLSMASTDKLGLEAIRSLHQQLDDDANGNIDLSESDDFLREELKYDSGYERRQRAFHRNDDMHISVRELWEAWLKSEVHNWTVEQTSEWLAVNVDLPQYVPKFIEHRVTGATLPRLAVNNMYYLSNVIGIKDPIHKQKIALKAMDVVLFGPPKEPQSLWKDLTLVTLLFGAIIGVWYTYLQRKKSRFQLHRMMKDMESLQRAELALEELQKELEMAKLAQENVATEKQNLEKRLQEAGGDNTSLHTSYSDLEVSQLKAEIEMLRTELQIAEGELKDRCWSPPLGLQQWLQLTHEIENKGYIKKKISAEKQLQQAREACEKLRKKRTSLVGAFVSTHGKSIDDVDRSIVEARTSLNEVTQELQERVHRWKQIELLCGFNIINNNGLQFLEGRISSSQDDLDDETSSVYTSCAGCVESGAWKESADSSGSEASRQDEDSSADFRSNNNVHFLVGGETANWGTDDHVMSKDHKDHNMSREHNTSREHVSQKPVTTVAVYTRPQSQPPVLKTANNNNNISNSIMVRSQSHDVNINTEHIVPSLNKQSQSETNLETPKNLLTKQKNTEHIVPNIRQTDYNTKTTEYHKQTEHTLKNIDHASKPTDHHPKPIDHSPKPIEHPTKPTDHAPKPSEPMKTADHSLRQKTIKEQPNDDETYSTDSTSSTVDEEIKKRRRKLFPTFSKKNKVDKSKKISD